MEDSSAKILEQHNLSKTCCREDILNVLIETDHALTEKDIKDKIDHEHERTTIYRTLRTFVEKDIIHSINLQTETLYALSLQREHAHFECVRCHAVRCLPNVAIGDLNLPEGFVAYEKKLFVKGICSTCNQN